MKRRQSHSTQKPPRYALEPTPHRPFDLAANRVIQDFPCDLLVEIFQKIETPKEIFGPQVLPFLISSRTVSKSWHIAIMKLDFSQFCDDILGRGYPDIESSCLNIHHLLKLFHFSVVHIHHREVDADLLVNLKGLSMTALTISPAQREEFTKLTQLKSLVMKDEISQTTLKQMTNLESLTLHHAHKIKDLDSLTKLKNLEVRAHRLETISALTNLQFLCLWGRTKIDPAETHCFTDLTIETDIYGFIRQGKGSYHKKTPLSNLQWCYSGDWQDGKPHGYGYQRYYSGATYEGQWQEGKRHGQGIVTLQDGSSFEGDMVDNCWHQGLRKYANGDTYQGYWTHRPVGDEEPWWLKSGHGVYTTQDGCIYDGEWEEDLFSQGKCVYPNGDVYEGDWWNSLRHGQGRYTFKNGEKIEGDWSHGNLLDDHKEMMEMNQYFHPHARVMAEAQLPTEWD